MFELVLADFAKSVGAGPTKRIVLQLDSAGWHAPKNLAVPDGIRLVLQPTYSPELQPAEHLWAFVDEPLANRCFDTIESLDAAIAASPSASSQTPSEIVTSSTGGHVSTQGRNQPESVSRHKASSCQAEGREGRWSSRQNGQPGGRRRAVKGVVTAKGSTRCAFIGRSAEMARKEAENSLSGIRLSGLMIKGADQRRHRPE
jgi:hypothetical protein